MISHDDHDARFAFGQPSAQTTDRKSFPQPEDLAVETDDPKGDLAPAIGIVNGVIYSIPIWILIAVLTGIFARASLH